MALRHNLVSQRRWRLILWPPPRPRDGQLCASGRTGDNETGQPTRLTESESVRLRVSRQQPETADDGRDRESEMAPGCGGTTRVGDRSNVGGCVTVTVNTKTKQCAP